MLDGDVLDSGMQSMSEADLDVIEEDIFEEEEDSGEEAEPSTSGHFIDIAKVTWQVILPISLK